MPDFTKICQVCKRDFSDLIHLMDHIKKDHSEIQPDKIFEMGKEQKWSLRK